MEYYQKKSMSLDTDGGVKVLSEKNGFNKNFQIDRMGPELIQIKLAI
jgi:hypothetical protein